MNFFTASQSFPPILCRLLARHKGGRPLTTGEIDSVAYPIDSNPALVEALSKTTRWDSIPFGDMHCYLVGCRIVFTSTVDMRRVTDYLRKNPNFEYLRKSPEWDSYYKPLLIRWRSSYIVGSQLPPYPPVRDLVIRLTPILK